MGLQLFDLTGRRALVTGCRQGTGLALAREMAGAGAAVVLNGRDREKLVVAAKDLPGARALPFDVTDDAAARAAVHGFEVRWGLPTP